MKVYALIKYRGIVQLVERWSPKPNVEGSSPSAPAVKALESIRILVLFYVKKYVVYNRNKVVYTKFVKKVGI